MGTKGKAISFALTGAGGEYARTLLSQSLQAAGVNPVVLCDTNTSRVMETCLDLGMSNSEVRVCGNAAQARRALEDGNRVVVQDLEILERLPFDVLVEATGDPSAGYDVAEAALHSYRHVVMASKEVESVAGVELGQLALEHGVGYAPARGDQPANLIAWWGYLCGLGLEIVALGKSSEVDLMFDPGTGDLKQGDQEVVTGSVQSFLSLGDQPRATLGLREELASELRRRSAADLCEMGVVCNYTGLSPDTPELHYPIVRTAELADVYALREHGGLLQAGGSVDVFSSLRLPGEASFAGGVFAIVRTQDPTTWRMLKGKGHVVSRDGRYACLYQPFHLMGVETVASILDVAVHERPLVGGRSRLTSVLGGRAESTLEAGRLLKMGGHHHEVEGVDPLLFSMHRAPADTAPLYLIGNSRLKETVQEGDVIRMSDLEVPHWGIASAWNRQCAAL